MEKITSFTIDHLKLVPGLYVSRKDFAGEQVITTFDIRMTNPNEEPVMNTAEVHTIEHLGATFLRNHRDYASKTLYFGPSNSPKLISWIRLSGTIGTSLSPRTSRAVSAALFSGLV